MNNSFRKTGESGLPVSTCTSLFCEWALDSLMYLNSGSRYCAGCPRGQICFIFASTLREDRCYGGFIKYCESWRYALLTASRVQHLNELWKIYLLALSQYFFYFGKCSGQILMQTFFSLSNLFSIFWKYKHREFFANDIQLVIIYKEKLNQTYFISAY